MANLFDPVDRSVSEPDARIVRLWRAPDGWPSDHGEDTRVTCRPGWHLEHQLPGLHGRVEVRSSLRRDVRGKRSPLGHELERDPEGRHAALHHEHDHFQRGERDLRVSGRTGDGLYLLEEPGRGTCARRTGVGPSDLPFEVGSTGSTVDGRGAERRGNATFGTGPGGSIGTPFS